MFRSLIAAMAVVTVSLTSANAQDIAAGKKVFKKCAACHVATEAKNKIGPHLFGVVDRAAGAVDGFKYSKNLLKQAEAGLVWNAAEISDYLKKPSAKIKGTKMAFAGLKKDDDIANVIAYLAEQKPQ